MEELYDLKQMHKLFTEAFKKIKQYDKIVITRHTNPDYDALACQMGLYQFLKVNFPKKEIHYIGKMTQRFAPTFYPFAEELPDSWFEENSGNYLSIVVDTGNSSRISENCNAKAGYVIKFDHHPNLEPFGDLNIVYDQFSSCAELISLFIFNLPRKYQFDAVMAKYLFVGMVTDSGRFRYNGTSACTFRVAAELISQGIDLQQVYNDLYVEELRLFKFKQYIYQNFKLSEKGTLYYVVTQDIMKEFDISSDETKTVLSSFTSVEGIGCAISVTETPEGDHKYRISARSKIKNVGKVMNNFGGGGHDQAAGGALDSLDQLPELIRQLDEAQ